MSTFVLPPERVEVIISHMNEDHADAVVLYARHFGGIEDAASAEMLGMDACKMLLRVTKEDGTISDREVPLIRELESVGDAKQVLIDMVHEARKNG